MKDQKKDRSKSSGQRDEKDPRSRDRKSSSNALVVGVTEKGEKDGRVSNNKDCNKVVHHEEETLLIREVAVGKGLGGTLKLLQGRGTLNETIELGGRNMDKKKSKLVGIYDNDKNASEIKEIHIDRRDEFGRILTPKEAFRRLSHMFHGKGPGKKKQAKIMQQFQEELKKKRMTNSDTWAERMREAQAELQTPYLVLSGNVPGQSRSGFATVEKDFAGGKKRESESQSGDASSSNKKPKTIGVSLTHSLRKTKMPFGPSFSAN